MWARKNDLLVGKEYLQILAKPPLLTEPTSYSIGPTKTKVNSFGCIPRGYITFAASVNGTRFCEGDGVEVKFACKNESKARIEFAEASIKESIHWTSCGHVDGIDGILSKQHFAVDGDMGKQSKYEMRVIKKVKKEIRGSTVVTSRGPSDTIYGEIISAVNDGTNKVNLRIPSHAHHTHNGKYIKIRHALRVCIKTPFYSSNPHADVNLKIVTPQSMAGEASVPSVPSSPILTDVWDASTVVAVPVVDSATVAYDGGKVLEADEISYSQ